MNRLPVEQRTQMVARLVGWAYADLPLARRQKIVWVAPGLANMMHQGRFSLWLLIYTHLLRQPPLRWLTPVGTPTEGQRVPSAFAGTGATSNGRDQIEPDQGAMLGHVLQEISKSKWEEE